MSGGIDLRSTATTRIMEETMLVGLELLTTKTMLQWNDDLATFKSKTVTRGPLFITQDGVPSIPSL